MGDTAGRQSPRLQTKKDNPPGDKKIEKLFNELNNKMDNLATKNSVSDLCLKVESLLVKHDDVLGQLSTHTEQIRQLEADNERLSSELNLLQEKFIDQDQYSRKDIVILTGLPYSDEESQTELNRAVLEILNKITGNELSLSSRDFVAVHRNRKNANTNRPPTITIKFLRFSDKDAMFTRRAKTTLKRMYSHIKLHHGMSPGYIDIRNKLSECNSVKFVMYEGANRFFTVCVSTDPGSADLFLNRIRNVEHFKLELSKVKSG